MSPLSHHLAVGLEALDLADAIIAKGGTPEVTAKGDRDMVTSVDLEIERVLREFLLEKTPDTGFLGEESGIVSPEADVRWVLDPVDGTANFARGLPLCAVSLGLVRDDRAVAGVVSLPLLGRRYWAAEGQGAFANGREIRVATTQRLAEAVVSLGDFAVGEHAPERNEPRLAITALLSSRAQRVRMFGAAAIDLVWVAEGLLDASVMLSNKPWDTAAGVAIARAAGATVVDVDGSDHTVASRATMTATPALADELLGIIRVAVRSKASTGGP